MSTSSVLKWDLVSLLENLHPVFGRFGKEKTTILSKGKKSKAFLFEPKNETARMPYSFLRFCSFSQYYKE
jgi:hypothetical protein